MSTSPATFPATERSWTLPSRSRVGMFCLIAAESAVFVIFLVAYIFYIGKSLTGPTPREVLEIPIFNTVCLLSSSLTIHFAARALQRGKSATFKLFWFLTLALGAIFLFGTGREWHRLIYRRRPDRFHKSVRHNLLLSRGPARVSRARGFAGTHDCHAVGIGRKSYAGARRARRRFLAVLAFCRCGLGGGFHDRVRSRTMN